jgi:hypothetical protein
VGWKACCANLESIIEGQQTGTSSFTDSDFTDSAFTDSALAMSATGRSLRDTFIDPTSAVARLREVSETSRGMSAYATKRLLPCSRFSRAWFVSGEIH